MGVIGMSMSRHQLSLLTACAALAAGSPVDAAAVAIDPPALHATNVAVEKVVYKGREAVRVADRATADTADGLRFAVIAGSNFTDGVIEVDLAGDTEPGAAPGFRGFTGLAFRMSPDHARYETFYLRPKNGRAEDQLQRNHSVQYDAQPDFPWQKLREETPGKYESYADLVAGEWTHVKIEVRGDKARLYVNGATQPVLIVNDLKHGQSQGAVALWIGPKTVAHFANLRITPQ